MKPAIYIRVSTTEQADEGFSVAAQEARLKGYCDLHELDPPVVFSDPGVSGGNLDRPGIQELIRDVTAGKISHVLVWRLDRLSRSLKDILYMSELFQDHGVAFVSFSENFDTATASGRLFFNITGVFAQFYRDQLSENIRMGMLQAAKEGKWLNRPSMGYDLVDGELVKNDDGLRVARAFKLAGEGKLSFHEIARQTGFKYSTVRYVLSNRVYLGEVKLQDQWFPGKHEALVSQEVFDQIQERRKPRTKKWHNRSKHYLSGFIHCGLCGRALAVGYPAAGKRPPAYACNHRNGSCPGIGQKSKTVIELAIFQALDAIGQDKQLLKKIRQRLGRDHTQFQKDIKIRQKTIEKQLHTVRSKKKKILEAFYQGAALDVLKDEEASLADQELSLSAENENLIKALSEKRVAIEDFDEFMDNFRSMDIQTMWIDATEDERKLALSSYFDKILLYRDRISIKVLGMPPIVKTWDDVKSVRSTNSTGGRGWLVLRTKA